MEDPSQCNEFVSAGGHVPPKQLKQKAGHLLRIYKTSLTVFNVK
jgi:hypothetical protein